MLHFYSDHDSGCGVPNADTITSPKVLITQLEKSHLLGPRNVLYLQKLLDDIHEKHLVEEVEKYVQEMNRNPLHTKELSSSSIGRCTKLTCECGVNCCSSFGLLSLHSGYTHGNN